MSWVMSCFLLTRQPGASIIRPRDLPGQIAGEQVLRPQLEGNHEMSRSAIGIGLATLCVFAMTAPCAVAQSKVIDVSLTRSVDGLDGGGFFVPGTTQLEFTLDVAVTGDETVTAIGISINRVVDVTIGIHVAPANRHGRRVHELPAFFHVRRFPRKG